MKLRNISAKLKPKHKICYVVNEMGLKIWIYGIIFVINIIFMGVKRGLLRI
jgi:hypothetical protein